MTKKQTMLTNFNDLLSWMPQVLPKQNAKASQAIGKNYAHSNLNNEKIHKDVIASIQSERNVGV